MLARRCECFLPVTAWRFLRQAYDPPAFHDALCPRNNDDTLETYGLKAGMVINMVLALRGGQ